MAKVRIATWNVNGLRARLDFVLRWLRDRRPDVVGLQEIKIEDDQFPLATFQDEGYHAAVFGQKSWNGVAILSREPAELVERGLPSQEDFGARLITARLPGWTYSTVYVPNGKSVEHKDFPDKLAWLDALRNHLGKLRDDATPYVIGGDFNICPGPLDSWNEEGLRGSIFHTDGERERLRAILDLGLRDLFREARPDLRQFSWWDYRGGAFHRKQGLRIDLLLADEAAARRLRSIEIDREYRKKQDGLTPSDHAPVIAEFE